MGHGLEKVDQLLPLPMAAYNLTLLRSLAALPRSSRSIDCSRPTGSRERADCSRYGSGRGRRMRGHNE